MDILINEMEYDVVYKVKGMVMNGNVGGGSNICGVVLVEI